MHWVGFGIVVALIILGSETYGKYTEARHLIHDNCTSHPHAPGNDDDFCPCVADTIVARMGFVAFIPIVSRYTAYDRDEAVQLATTSYTQCLGQLSANLAEPRM